MSMGDGVASAKRHSSLSVDPERLDRRSSGAQQQSQLQKQQPPDVRKSLAEGFTPEQMTEVYDLFTMFDRNSDGRIGRNEFGPMMKTLGLNLTDREMNMFFDRMDDSGDGFIEFHELTEFLQNIARPITLEEELTEAFRFFGPTVGNGAAPSVDGDLDMRKSMITKKGLAKILADMGEDITEAECGDMIAAATGGLEEIDFRTFQRFVQARAAPGYE